MCIPACPSSRPSAFALRRCFSPHGSISIVLQAAGLFDLLHGQAPAVEQAQPGGIYFGLAGLEQRDEDALTLCCQQSEMIYRELQLATTVGVAVNKFTAEVASLCIGLNRVLVLSAGTEREFLGDFPVTLLPVEEETQRRLQLFGLRRLDQFARLPPAAVLAQFGWEEQRAPGWHAGRMTGR